MFGSPMMHGNTRRSQPHSQKQSFIWTFFFARAQPNASWCITMVSVCVFVSSLFSVFPSRWSCVFMSQSCRLNPAQRDTVRTRGTWRFKQDPGENRPFYICEQSLPQAHCLSLPLCVYFSSNWDLIAVTWCKARAQTVTGEISLTASSSHRVLWVAEMSELLRLKAEPLKTNFPSAESINDCTNKPRHKHDEVQSPALKPKKCHLQNLLHIHQLNVL